MIAKTFEIRDRGTFIPVLAVKLVPKCESDRYLFSRAGYGVTPDDQASYVQVMLLAGGEGMSNCVPMKWGGRTMPIAHEYIIKRFDVLPSGSVIDVEYILAEKIAPSPSEKEKACDY